MMKHLVLDLAIMILVPHFMKCNYENTHFLKVITRTHML